MLGLDWKWKFYFAREKVYIPTKEFIDLSIFCLLSDEKENGIKGNKILKWNYETRFQNKIFGKYVLLYLHFP